MGTVTGVWGRRSAGEEVCGGEGQAGKENMRGMRTPGEESTRDSYASPGQARDENQGQDGGSAKTTPRQPQEGRDLKICQQGGHSDPRYLRTVPKEQY